jgi:predicted transposase YbfD/YdcC
MSSPPVGTIGEHFAALDDPRVERTRRHELLELLTVALCGVLCAAESWVEVEQFGNAKLEWFRTFLALPNGIPSHDTFGRVFARLDPEQFQACFVAWVRDVVTATAGPVGPGHPVVAVDGKTVRRSHDRTAGRAAIHMVSAWASAHRLVLAQVKVDAKSNEITAIPALLDLLLLRGCIVTIDAMGCQTAIARQIVAQGGDYVLALKENQGRLHAAVEGLFARAGADGGGDLTPDSYQTLEKDHGRIETRRYWTIADPAVIAGLDPAGAWDGLRSVGKVEATRAIGDTCSTETRYFISSVCGDAAAFGHAVRLHWGIENSVHWVLDVAFREDECRVRTDHAAHNFAILRHVALNLLRQDTTAKCGIKARRLKAGWSTDYLRHVLSL